MTIKPYFLIGNDAAVLLKKARQLAENFDIVSKEYWQIQITEYADTFTTADARDIEQLDVVRPATGIRCFIINLDNIHKQALNVLLKVLEEAKNTDFILYTTQPTAIPETIFSRCSIIPIEGLTEKELRAFLSRKGVQGVRAENISKEAGGSITRAQEIIGEEYRIVQLQSLVETFQQGTFGTVFNSLRELSHEDIEMLCGILMKEFDIIPKDVYYDSKVSPFIAAVNMLLSLGH